MGVGKVLGETERRHKWAGKVTMTTLWVAPTQTSLQVLEEKKGNGEQGSHRTWFSPFFPFSLAIKTKEKQFTTEDE